MLIIYPRAKSLTIFFNRLMLDEKVSIITSILYKKKPYRITVLGNFDHLDNF